MPEWVSTYLVMLNESWFMVSLVLVISLLIIRYIWKKLTQLGLRILVLALTIPLSTGVGFVDSAMSLADDYGKNGKSISKLYDLKKSELFKEDQKTTETKKK